jgi:hypothetical protein
MDDLYCCHFSPEQPAFALGGIMELARSPAVRTETLPRHDLLHGSRGWWRFSGRPQNSPGIGVLRVNLAPMFRFAVLVSCFLLAAPLSMGADQPLSRTLRESYRTMKMFLIAGAEDMPEQYYDFKISQDWRSFSEYIVHVAEANYISCSTLRVIPNPGVKISPTMSKAELLEKLNASFEFCDPAFADATDAKLMTKITSGDRTLYPVEEMIALTNSLYEHYGNVASYLRVKGITPRSTLRTNKVLQ